MTRLPSWITEPDLECSDRERTDLEWTSVDHSIDLALSGYGTAGDLLTAAHARVLSDLTAESEVGFAERRADGSVRIRRLTVPAGPWRGLIERARESRSVPDPAAFEIDSLIEVGADDRSAPAEAPADPVTLWVIWTGTSLRIGYRPDRLDRAAAERIGGYHLVALRSMITEPGRPHQETSLVSDDERDQQLKHLAGPQIELPDLRVHQLIEDQVRRRPAAIAAVCGADRWSYAELNARANRIAHGLLQDGVGAEDVVAVVTERNLDWLACVLAILKSGACYLPIEPHFPAGRIEASLRRSQCRLVLTEPGSRSTLDEAMRALPDLIVKHARDLSGDPRRDTDQNPDLVITADQLAYIYFTSGSTGQPKGAMCEQAGMLNHILAKIEDLQIREGAVVAQTAPQCFDISLWQLLAGLVVGGRTVIIEQPVILELASMIDILRTERVEVLQLVPSYLEVLLSYLDRAPADLGDLRVLSVTGEAVKAELVQRFFAHPVSTGVALVNAYGLTETSDDTNHEVMHSAPDDGRVALGAPVRNVVVYVVDELLRPVPLGAPGEIVFSGVCVGRGYVNDPERTAAAFGQDPHRSGDRLYRSGDIGRWRPDGKLEFLGRRDAQLKISGFRIEIGEIENTLLRAPGVRDAAVVVITSPDGSRRLVGFYASERPVPPQKLHDHLSHALPHYMVPAALHHRPRLPLSGNGKIDRAALTALAEERAGSLGRDSAERAAEAEWTAAERAVAQAWAGVLGIEADGIARTDHFFDRGGTSLSAVKVVIALGRVLTLADVAGHPVLHDQARALAARRAKSAPVAELAGR